MAVHHTAVHHTAVHHTAVQHTAVHHTAVHHTAVYHMAVHHTELISKCMIDFFAKLFTKNDVIKQVLVSHGTPNTRTPSLYTAELFCSFVCLFSHSIDPN